MMKKIVTLLSIALVLFSCDVVKDLGKQALGTYQLTQCKYEFNSISGVALSGINLQNITSLTNLNPLDLVKLTSAFATSSGSLPINFTLNLDVSNPGAQSALLNGLDYVMEIDGRQMTTGSIAQRVQINSGQKTVLPINMAFDLKQVLSGQSLESIKNIALSLAGISGGSSNVTMKLQPSFIVGNQTLKAPNYIPLSFQLKK
ncbi:MAG: hypothetical protein LBG77_08135 [Dysgonamonadaceae bacterium]|jgi:hypothetical protein|nr:hypothetical protein [Dysgonamonadaceae bacterium]